MKSVLLLGYATLAASAGIEIQVEKISVNTSSDPEFGGCVANTVITTQEQCYAAAAALRSAGALGADSSAVHANSPFPQVNPPGGWTVMPKGCVVWNVDQIHWNEGSDAGTGTPHNSVTNTICLVHDPEVQHKAVGDPCKEIERIHGAEQCEAAGGELGISGTMEQVNVADRPQGCSSDADGFYWNIGDGSSAPDDHQAICTSGKVWKDKQVRATSWVNDDSINCTVLSGQYAGRCPED